VSHTKPARTHLHDGAVLEFMPFGRGPWRRGTVRQLPEGRWVVEEMGRGQRFVLDGSLQYRSIDGAPIHLLSWLKSQEAVA